MINIRHLPLDLKALTVGKDWGRGFQDFHDHVVGHKKRNDRINRINLVRNSYIYLIQLLCNGFTGVVSKNLRGSVIKNRIEHNNTTKTIRETVIVIKVRRDKLFLEKNGLPIKISSL